jgi:hypothetical protein
MNRIFFAAAAAAVAAFALSACAEPPASTARTPSTPIDNATRAEAPRRMPVAAAFVTHDVKDYDAWKTAFDEGAPARKSAGIKGVSVKRSAERPNGVTVFVAADSADVIGKFLGDPETKSSMERAGVVAPPTVLMFTPVENKTIKGRAPAAMIGKHDVADFDTWKAQFDAGAELRAKAGVIGHAIGRVTGSPNTVVLYLEAETVDSLRRLMSSEDLKASMSKAGVQGTPELSFLEGK